MERKSSLKPKHRRNLKKFAKLLHGLGVNVSEHIEKLELDEAELKDIREKIGKDTFLRPKDRINLKLLLKKIYNLMEATVRLEDTLWEEVAPPIFAAYRKKMHSSGLILLAALREIHKGLFQKKITNLKAGLPEIRNLILASVAKEHETIFQKYSGLLKAIERTVSELLEVEFRYTYAAHSAKNEFSELNSSIRKILHEDIYFLSKDIAKLYDMRTAIYNWLIEADRMAAPAMAPTAEKEKAQLFAASRFYVSTYKQHIKNISQIYLGRGEGK